MPNECEFEPSLSRWARTSPDRPVRGASSGHFTLHPGLLTTRCCRPCRWVMTTVQGSEAVRSNSCGVIWHLLGERWLERKDLAVYRNGDDEGQVRVRWAGRRLPEG
jgi:hypothetical protein